MLRRALLNIYSKEFHPASEIEVCLFNEIWAQINNAAKEGFGQSRAADPDEDFRNEILRNNAVFSAFKVHRMQNDMARLLLDSKGNLKPFEQWKNEVMPIASHQSAPGFAPNTTQPSFELIKLPTGGSSNGRRTSCRICAGSSQPRSIRG